MTTTKRPTGFSEILNPTEAEIAEKIAQKKSGELRVIFDRTTRGRVRAVWFRKVAKKIEPGTIDEEITQLKSSIARPFILTEPSALVNAALNAKCLEENGRPPLNGDALKIDVKRYLHADGKWMELTRDEPDYLDERLAATSKEMAEPVVTTRPDLRDVEMATDRMMTDGPSVATEKAPVPVTVFGSSNPALRRVPRPHTPRPNTGDSVAVVSEGSLPVGPRLSTIFVLAWTVFFLTIVTLICLGHGK